MARYSVGDVVIVDYPYRDKGVLVVKTRPAVVLSVTGDEHYLVQCTTSNRSDKLAGIWVLQASSEGSMMGITKNTFINATQTIELQSYYIRRKIGTCPFISELNDLINS